MAETAQAVNCGYFDGFKLGKKQKHFLWIAALAYAFEMIDGGLFNYVTPVLQADWGITMEKISTLQSLTFIGMFSAASLAAGLRTRSAASGDY